MGQVYDLVLSAPQASVLLAMTDHADHLGQSIKPGLALLAWKTGYGIRQIRRLILELRAIGALELVRQSSGRPGSTNLYRTTFDRAKKKPPFRESLPKETADILTPVQGETGDISVETADILTETADISEQTADIQMSHESSSRTTIYNHQGESNAEGTPPLPPTTSEVETESEDRGDDPEDVFEPEINTTAIRTYTPRQHRLLAFASKHGAILEHPKLGDLRPEWLRDLEAPGTTLEEAEEAFLAAGHSCLPSHWRRYFPAAEERQAKADAAAKRKRDAEYLAREAIKSQEWKDRCARIIEMRRASGITV